VSQHFSKNNLRHFDRHLNIRYSKRYKSNPG